MRDIIRPTEAQTKRAQFRELVRLNQDKVGLADDQVDGLPADQAFRCWSQAVLGGAEYATLTLEALALSGYRVVVPVAAALDSNNARVIAALEEDMVKPFSPKTRAQALLVERFGVFIELDSIIDVLRQCGMTLIEPVREVAS